MIDKDFILSIFNKNIHKIMSFVNIFVKLVLGDKMSYLNLVKHKFKLKILKLTSMKKKEYWQN